MQTQVSFDQFTRSLVVVGGMLAPYMLHAALSAAEGGGVKMLDTHGEAPYVWRFSTNGAVLTMASSTFTTLVASGGSTCTGTVMGDDTFFAPWWLRS